MIAIRMLLVFTVLTGVVYPLAMNVLAQALFRSLQEIKDNELYDYQDYFQRQCQ